MAEEKPLLPKMLEDYSAEELEQIRDSIAVHVAAQDKGFAGYKEFYRLIFGKKLPDHVLDWVKVLDEELEKQIETEDQVRIIIEAFRGSTKTTSFTVGYTAFYIGHHPSETNMLVQVSDDSATNNAKAISNVIERNPVWKMIFPHVVPDKKKGWSDSGYYVKDDSDKEWETKMAGVPDPTIMGLGYRSSVIIGKHPTGLLIIDDIHDENNTASDIEMQRVIKTLTGTILLTMTDTTKQLFIGTPWKKNDAMAFLKNTKQYRCIWTPALWPKLDEEGKEVMDGDGNPVYEYTWPEFRGKKFLAGVRAIVGTIEFARMYFLDLKGLDGYVLKGEWLREYPSEKINKNWPKVVGIDYADVWDPKKADKRDFLCLSFGYLIPGGGVVLYDGLRLQLSKAESLLKIESVCTILNPKRVGFEAIGKGEAVAADLVMSSPLPYYLIKNKPPKPVCYVDEMAPQFELGFITIASDPTPYLTKFREEWLSFGVNSSTDDCLDATWIMMRACRDVLAMARSNMQKSLKDEEEEKKEPVFSAFYDRRPNKMKRTIKSGR